MITVTVNGESRQISTKTTMSELLVELHVNARYCAVERNRELLPREEHEQTELDEGDRIEIVTLVGGG